MLRQTHKKYQFDLAEKMNLTSAFLEQNSMCCDDGGTRRENARENWTAF